MDKITSLKNKIDDLEAKMLLLRREASSGNGYVDVSALEKMDQVEAQLGSLEQQLADEMNKGA